MQPQDFSCLQGILPELALMCIFYADAFYYRTDFTVTRTCCSCTFEIS